ncbi:MAG: hypothetical protein KC463_07350 [Streptococcus sp.]|nr:hypothetical protein [Streptococcus sp.]
MSNSNCAFSVTVRQIPGDNVTKNFDAAVTVRQALQTAGIAKIDSWSPKIGGEEVSLDRRIASDTTITLLRKQIKGNK